MVLGNFEKFERFLTCWLSFFLFWLFFIFNSIYFFTFLKIGSYKIPVGGFANMPLKIIRAYDTDALPTAHTCFYEVEIPDYATKG